MSVDRIVLRGLRVKGNHGVFEFERRDGQEFVIDAVLGVDPCSGRGGRSVAYRGLRGPERSAGGDRGG